ncbi:6-carboxyhexanoate--CoA ligase [uncultured archaeon]|nr:6-carboxyhexanoate--CoA ligase [uncultured archaeon]
MYSVRMRATKDEMHISGAERLVDEKNIKIAAVSMIERALSHDRGKPDFINISVEEIETPIKEITSLPINLVNVNSVEEGKKVAKKVLSHIGIPYLCVEKAFTLLENGPSDGENMRGAIVMDMKGERLEPDKRRGIRASHMDITPIASLLLADALSKKGLTRHFTHVKEALVLATKVAFTKGSIAELCWSDDPFYTTGYVASGKLGYVRIPHLKKEGDYRGGRVFFVDNVNITDYIEEIEKTPVLITKFDGLREISDLNNITGE